MIFEYNFSGRKFIVRNMNRCELDLAIGWAAAEGWNPGLHDAESFFAYDPNGFFIGLLEGEPAGSVSAVGYGDDFGFAGLFIVRSEFRRLGLGVLLGQTALMSLGRRIVGLDGVLAQQENYAKAGFRIAHRNLRYQGTGGGAAPEGMVPLAEFPFDRLVSYDREFFPGPREEFLRLWIRQPQATALGALRGGRLSGYGVIRPCRTGHKIGPLFADDEKTADDLFRALMSTVPGQPFFLDLPATNPAALALAERYSMQVVFETARMYIGAKPSLPIPRIYGITTSALG